MIETCFVLLHVVIIIVLENTISDWNSKNTKGEIYMSKVLENTISDWNKEVAPDLAKDL